MEVQVGYGPINVTRSVGHDMYGHGNISARKDWTCLLTLVCAGRRELRCMMHYIDLS